VTEIPGDLSVDKNPGGDIFAQEIGGSIQLPDPADLSEYWERDTQLALTRRPYLLDGIVGADDEAQDGGEVPENRKYEEGREHG